MTDIRKSVKDWEAHLGVIFIGDIDLKKKVTEDEALELIRGGASTHVPVNHEGRKKWLEYNGYEVTRENMINGSLPTVKMPKGFESNGQS